MSPSASAGPVTVNSAPSGMMPMTAASRDGPPRRLTSESAVMTVLPGSMALSDGGGVAVGAEVTIAGVAVATGLGVAVTAGLGVAVADTAPSGVSADSIVITEVGAWFATGAAEEVAAGGDSVAGGGAGSVADWVSVAGVGVMPGVVAEPLAPAMLTTSSSPTRSSGAEGTRRMSVSVTSSGTANQTR